MFTIWCKRTSIHSRTTYSTPFFKRHRRKNWLHCHRNSCSGYRMDRRYVGSFKSRFMNNNAPPTMSLYTRPFFSALLFLTISPSPSDCFFSISSSGKAQLLFLLFISSFLLNQLRYRTMILDIRNVSFCILNLRSSNFDFFLVPLENIATNKCQSINLLLANKFCYRIHWGVVDVKIR